MGQFFSWSWRALRLFEGQGALCNVHHAPEVPSEEKEQLQEKLGELDKVVGHLNEELAGKRPVR